MLRYLILVILLAVVGGWLALRLNPSPIFTEGMVGQPVDLIPGQGPINPVDEVLENLLFRPLFRYNVSGEIEADLADNYRLSSDSLVYTVTLKESAWADGRPVTAADVAFTFTRDSAFSDITIEQVGEKEIRFLLKTPLSTFLDILTRPVAPAHFRQIKIEQLGNGKFSVSGIKQEGETIREMELKPTVFGRIRTLRFKFFTTEEELQTAARVGEIDGLASEDFSDPSFMLYQTPAYSKYFALFFNLESTNSLTKNKSFRLAAAAKAPQFSGGSRVFGPFSGTWAQKDVKTPSPTKKKFKGSLAISVPSEKELIEVVQVIKETWESSLGISVSIEKIPAAELANVIADRNFEAIILGQEVERDPDRYNLWHSSAQAFPGQNISSYADPRSDRALEEARKVSSRSARRTHYLNFQKLFVENNPAVLLYHPNLYYWVNRKFEGPDLTTVFSSEERFWNFADWSFDFAQD